MSVFGTNGWRGNRLLVAWLIDYIVEFALYGIVVGLIYRPLATSPRRPVVA